MDERNLKRKANVVHTSGELELLDFVREASGLKTIDGARGLLNHLRHPSRQGDLELLGFAAPRSLPKRVVTDIPATDGLPSGARFSDHKRRLSPNLKRDMWQSIYMALRDNEVSLAPDDELLVGYMDTTLIDTIYTPPRYKPGTEEIENPRRITCDGSYLPRDSFAAGARGYKATILWSSNCMPLGFVTSPNKDHENVAALALLEQVGPLLKQRITEARERKRNTVGVIVADSGFHSDALRNQVRKMGYVECITCSASYNEEQVRMQNERWMPFRHRPEWGTNGHREIACLCGESKYTRVFHVRANGAVSPRVFAECRTHGSFHVTSGEYELASNEWVRADSRMTPSASGSGAERVELRLGNDLTHNNEIAKQLWTKRWAHNEGAHAALATSGLLLDGNNRFRTQTQVDTALYMVMSYLHLRGIQYRRAVAASAAEAA